MTIKLGVVMDPIASIHYQKDSTLAMLEEAQKRGFELYYFEQKDLSLRNGEAFGDACLLTITPNHHQWFSLQDKHLMPLAELDIILMRKDPPFNQEYIYTTYILEHAERLGVLVVNRSQSLRDSNEKLFATLFPQCTPPSLVTQSQDHLYEFWRTYKDIVCKPLDSMGGTSIFRLQENDVNAIVIFETLTQHETCYMMAQRYIPQIQQGDKRILMIDGEPIPYLLARLPQGKDWRGNLVLGAKGTVQPLSPRDQFICQELGPTLRARGLYFVGLDVIGDYLTEINVTSPTGIREIDAGAGINVSAVLMDCIEKKLQTK